MSLCNPDRIAFVETIATASSGPPPGGGGFGFFGLMFGRMFGRMMGNTN